MSNERGEVFVYDRSQMQEMSHEEIWDDTLLIQEYDEAMKQARKQLAKKLKEGGTSSTDTEISQVVDAHHTAAPPKVNNVSNSHYKKKKKKKCKRPNEWHIGDHCQARYSEDGLLYEGTIVGIRPQEGTCTVRFVGYNNQEDIALSALLKSKGENARARQMDEALAYQTQNDDDDSSMAESGLHSDTDNERRFYRKDQKMHSTLPGSMGHIPSYLPDLPPPPAVGILSLNGDRQSTEALHTMLMSWYMTGYHTGYYQGLVQGRQRKV